MLAAKQLHVRVMRDGIERVRLALPPGAAKRLSMLMPPQVADEALASGINLTSLEESAETDLSPRTLLDYTSREGKHVEIWLE